MSVESVRGAGGGMRSKWLALGLVSWLGIPTHAQQTLYVDDDTCPAAGNGSNTIPFCRIQDAICTLRSVPGGGTVLVRPGTYHEAVRMFKNVSLVSTAGAAVTTIDATGEPCLTSSCTVSTTSPCAVVYFPSAAGGGGASERDRLEGFTLTGGAGIHQTCSGTCDLQAGGGIFVLHASPTITRNTITGNVLHPSSTAQIFGGAGIYVGGSTARPVITANVIEGNVADPGPGTSSQPRYALGGGIYVAYPLASAWIEGNTFRNNRAGSASPFQFGGGGGIAVDSNPLPVPVVTRNHITGNTAYDRGGRLFLAYTWDNGPGRSQVDNNLIQGNSASHGGGIHMDVHDGTIVNNTIVDNTAEQGGGVWISSVNGSGKLWNNLVTGNTATTAGGGIFVDTFRDEASVQYTDAFANAPENVAGDWTDAQFLAQPGNLIADPQYVPGEFRLQTGSPVLDVGLNSVAGSLDGDGAPRIQDGDGDGTAIVDLGAFERSTDFDRDGVPDWIDDDDDGDGVADAADCAPLDPAAQTPPPEVSGLSVEGSGPTQLTWTSLGPHLRYDVAGGSLLGLRLSDGPPAVCLADDLEANGWTDSSPDPVPGGGTYYLVRAQGVCGGSYGSGRVIAACP